MSESGTSKFQSASLECPGISPAHIYENHIEQLHEQLKRNPHKYALPKLELNPNVKEIDDFRPYDIKIVGYKSYPAIKLELNVGL